MKIVITIEDENGRLAVHINEEHTKPATNTELGVAQYMSQGLTRLFNEMFDGADELAKENGRK